MISLFLSKLADRLWPIGEFAMGLANELRMNPDAFSMVNSVEGLLKTGHIHLRARPDLDFVQAPFAYGLLICNFQIHLVDGENLRVTFDHPPADRPLNWREYEMLEQALNQWLRIKWCDVTAHLTDEQLEALIQEG